MASVGSEHRSASSGLRNWAGNYEYQARHVHRPRTVDEIIAVVAEARHVRVLGARHSFTDIVDAEELISLEDMAGDASVDVDAGTVTVPAQHTYAEVALALRAHGLALRNMASLPHITVGGAIATATHGSGERNGNLATAVAGLEMVNAAGQIVRAHRSDHAFNGVVVSLGGLGVVHRVTLDVELDFEIEQYVFDDLSLDVLGESFDEVVGAAHSVSVFTNYRDGRGQVWIKRRSDGRDGSVAPGQTFLGAVAAPAARHPVPGMAAEACTAQFGEPGPWWDRLPHFREGSRPNAGDEVQSEYFVPRAQAVAALESLRRGAAEFAPALMVSEVRTVAADDLWLSPQHGRDSVAFHFTWHNDAERVRAAVAAVELALTEFEFRPHWGKVFNAQNFSASSYPRHGDFIDLADRLDPHGVFRNDWWRRHIEG